MKTKPSAGRISLTDKESETLENNVRVLYPALAEAVLLGAFASLKVEDTQNAGGTPIDMVPLPGHFFLMVNAEGNVTALQLPDSVLPHDLQNPDNRVTEEDVENAIVSITNTVLPSGKAMVCEITLANGFTVTGDSGVVDPANMDVRRGAGAAEERARAKVWQMLGFAKQESMSSKPAETKKK